MYRSLIIRVVTLLRVLYLIGQIPLLSHTTLYHTIPCIRLRRPWTQGSVCRYFTAIEAFGSIWSEGNSIELFELVPQFVCGRLFALETSLTAPGAPQILRHLSRKLVGWIE